MVWHGMVWLYGMAWYGMAWGCATHQHVQRKFKDVKVNTSHTLHSFLFMGAVANSVMPAL